MASSSNATSQIRSSSSQQVFLLDLIFPGFTALSSSVWPLLTDAPSLYGRLLCICGLLVLIGRYGSKYFRELLETYFTSKIEVPYNDEAYDMLILWVRSQPFAQLARASLATVNLKSSARSNGLESHANKKPLRYSPCNGRSYFWHKGYLFVFERRRNQGELGITKEEACISYFGRNPTVLRELLDECRQHYLGLIKNKTCVFEHEADRWKPSKSKNKRDMSTVFINKKLKKKLLDDVGEFLDPKTRIWYSTRGLPYQRGYLFYGPPGTGKSSLSLSMAGQFDLDVYVLTMSSLNDQSLKALFAELPQHCIVLLEDLDATGLNRTQDSGVDASQSHGKNGSPRMSAGGRVSLSTLLNVLDGVGSPEGRVLIMTTNHVERLDPALIRPGRADMKVEFQLADEEMLTHLFAFVYDSQLESGVFNETGKESAKIEETLKLGQEFVAKIPKLTLSPAEVLSFLLANKQSPRQAIAGVDAWLENGRGERKVTRSDSWVLHDRL